MTRHPRALAWGCTLLNFSLAAATVVFLVLGGAGPGAGQTLFFVAIFSAVGGLVAIRRPGHRVGWLCLTIGLLFGVVSLQAGIAWWAADRGMLGTANWVGVAGSLWVPALGIAGTHLPLRLPDGSLLSPRWRWYSRFCTAVILFVGVVITTEPGRVNEIRGTENPLALDLHTLAPLFLLFPLSFLGAIVSLVLRRRRAGSVERLQLRWIAFGGLFFVISYLPALLPALGLVSNDGATSAVLEATAQLGFGAIPVAIGVSVLRYRLYDIDVVVNRTLVYGLLTAALAGTYLGSVLLLQLALRPLTSQSNLAIAGSTLAVAALFGPARARIQAAVDRRFYRRKYDAARTLEGFSARLREQVDLDALGGELRSVVAETMQPAHVSLWLRSP